MRKPLRFPRLPTETDHAVQPHARPPIIYDFEQQLFLCRGCSATVSAQLPGDPLRASALVTLQWAAEAAEFATLHHRCPTQCRAPSPQIAGMCCVRPIGHRGVHHDGIGGSWPLAEDQPTLP